MFGARGVSSVTLGSLPPVLLAVALGRRVSRKSACKDRSSLGSISRFVSARQLDLVYDRDNHFGQTCFIFFAIFAQELSFWRPSVFLWLSSFWLPSFWWSSWPTS